MSGGKYDQIREACEKAKAGEWSEEELTSFIQALLGTLRAQREAIAGYVAETGYSDFSGQEVDVGLQGAQKFEEGLERILASRDAIDDGLKMISEGTQLINQAMGINREERRKLEEEV